MEHLTIGEIVEFVTLKKLDENAIALAKKVNGHIRNCDNCLELLRGVRTLHEEITSMKENESLDLNSLLESRTIQNPVIQSRIEMIKKEFNTQMDY